MKLKNYVPAAKELVNQSNFWVTGEVIESLDSIVKLRTECNDICENEGCGTAEERERHKYPVHVFKEVGEILRSRLKVGSLSPSSEPDTFYLSTLTEGQTRSEQEAIDAAQPKLPDMDKAQTAGDLASLVTIAPKFPVLMESLKRIRLAVQWCWSIRKACINKGDRV